MVGRMPTSRDMPGLSFEYLYDEPIELVARAGHPALGRDPVRALSEFPLILPQPRRNHSGHGRPIPVCDGAVRPAPDL